MAKLTSSAIRPAQVCKALLAALEAADGRRRSRKRDQTPDAIGLRIKRELLQRAVEEDPPPERFEAWLLECQLQCSDSAPAGAISAMARSIFDEWTLAHSMNDFKMWLEHGAPSDDAESGVISTPAAEEKNRTLTESSSESPVLLNTPSRNSSPSSPSPPPRGRGKGEGEFR